MAHLTCAHEEAALSTACSALRPHASLANTTAPEACVADWLTPAAALPVLLLVAVLLFFGLALVCEEYLLPSLTVACRRHRISAHVAGATLLAAGCNAPELVASAVGIFVSHSTIGAGTVVGSAPFNVLVITGCVALASPGGRCTLDCWLIGREAVCLLLALLLLTGVMADERVTWIEAALLVAFYAAYVMLAVHWDALVAFVWGAVPVATRMPEAKLFKPSSPRFVEGALNAASGVPDAADDATEAHDEGAHYVAFDLSSHPAALCQLPSPLPERILHALTLPIAAPIRLTTPDTRLPANEKWYLLALGVSLAWLIGLASILLPCLDLLGCIVDFDSTVHNRRRPPALQRAGPPPLSPTLSPGDGPHTRRDRHLLPQSLCLGGGGARGACGHGRRPGECSANVCNTP